jgi:hypothetical protein
MVALQRLNDKAKAGLFERQYRCPEKFLPQSGSHDKIGTDSLPFE